MDRVELILRKNPSSTGKSGGYLVVVNDRAFPMKLLLIATQEYVKAEYELNKDIIAKTHHFFAKEALIDAINGKNMDEICKKYKLPKSGGEVIVTKEEPWNTIDEWREIQKRKMNLGL